MTKEFYTIQRFCWPQISFSTVVDLYFKTEGLTRIYLNSNRVDLSKYSTVSFDSFYNGFSIGKWKKYCSLADLSFFLLGKGKVVIRLGLHQLDYDDKWLYEEEVTLDYQNQLIRSVPLWDSLSDGMLFITVQALEENVVIQDGGFLTQQKPINQVKLGVVITHFNRKQYVLPAIQRITDELLHDPCYKEKINLIVIDNSRNILQEEAQDAILIPNKNLGGSGGFMRGLLYLKDQGGYTHCLFMDDDASCEIESIKRAYGFFSYVKSSKVALAGALLLEDKPSILYEKGAQFNGLCRPLNSNLHLGNVTDLLIAEKETEKSHYGGWWFFMFDIGFAHSFAFPFFVKGDDILFSIMNNFDIVTINGIACLGEGFDKKSGTLSTYLDARNHIVHELVRDNTRLLVILSVAFKFFLKAIFSYRYATAHYVTLAIKHVSQGKQFWIDNIDLGQILSEVANVKPSEKMLPLNLSQFDIDYVSYDESIIRKVIRILTLNGFLLPSFLLKDRVVYQDHGFKGWFRAIFRYKEVIYYNSLSNTGFIAKHNKYLFFKGFFFFIKEIINFVLNFKKIERNYKESVSYLTSEAFWREIYQLKS